MSTLKGKFITVILVVMVALAAYGIGAGHLFVPATAEASPALYEQSTVTTVFNAVSPAVVEIDITQSSSFFNQTSGLGSGILIDTEGNILTNNHVVDGATSVSVKLDNGDSIAATVIGKDSIHDLAVVKVDASAVAGITPLTFGDSGQVQPGQMAIAIGNPYGLDDTVTVGVISGLNRSIGNLTGLIQTDASINPGNSGGPLLVVDSTGMGVVIGINTAIETSPTGTTGIGFAVPSNVVTNILPNLKSGISVERPWIGLSGAAITDTLVQELSLPVTSGVYVISIVEDSPAQAAGLVGSNLDDNGDPATGGDIITAIDGESVATVSDISNYINSYKKVGDVVTLSILRSGNEEQVQITLGTWPDNLTENMPQINPEQPFPFQIPDMPFGDDGHHFWRSDPSY